MPHPGTWIYETLLYLTCRAANGESDETNVVRYIWRDVADLDVRRIDGQQLTYWKDNKMGARQTIGLLSKTNGNCEAWASFLRDSLLSHGIIAHKIMAFPIADGGILVRNWRFKEESHGFPPYPYIVGMDAFDEWGIAGQGNPNPPGYFNGHWITEWRSTYYDPSYGTKPVSGVKKDKLYEDAALDGYSFDLPPTRVRKNDRSPDSDSEMEYTLDPRP